MECQNVKLPPTGKYMDLSILSISFHYNMVPISHWLYPRKKKKKKHRIICTHERIMEDIFQFLRETSTVNQLKGQTSILILVLISSPQKCTKSKSRVFISQVLLRFLSFISWIKRKQSQALRSKPYLCSPYYQL